MTKMLPQQRCKVKGGSALYRKAHGPAAQSSENFRHLDGVPLVSLSPSEFEAVFDDMEAEWR